VYLVCTAKPAFVGFWDFSVFGKSITYLFSVPLGRSIPSLATTHLFLSLRSKPLNGVSCLLFVLHLLRCDSARGQPRRASEPAALWVRGASVFGAKIKPEQWLFASVQEAV
jgi:hypothetical protein